MAWNWPWDTVTKYYDGDMTRDTDWGGDDSTGNLPVSGGRLQKWLKDELNVRVGYTVRSTEKEEDGLYHVRGFATEEDYNAWLGDKEQEADRVVTHFTIPDMSSTTASYVLNLVSGAGNYIVSTDGKVVLPLRFVSVMFSPIDQSSTDTGEAGLLTVQTRSSSTAQWSTKGTMTIASLSKDSSEYIDVDISQYLSNGEQQVRVIVKGETSEASTNYVTMTVVKTTLSITFANDWQNPVINAALPLSYYINGAVEKTLHLLIDGKRSVQGYKGSGTFVDTPYTMTVTDSSDESNPVCIQGIHTIEAWLSVDVTGVSVESEHVTSQVLVILDDSVEGRYVIMNDVAEKLVNWTEQKLFSYAVYNSDGTTLPLTFVLSDYNRTTQYASFPMGNVEEGVKYDFSNMIEIEETEETFSARLDIMSGAETLATYVLEVDNSQNFAPTEGADFIFNPKLRSNQEENPATVVNAATGEVIDSEFVGFGYVNDAYTVDDSGNKCFRVLAGDEIRISGYEAFSGFMGSNHTSSLTMEFDFAVRNITDEDTPILKMCSYNNGIPVGWEMKPLEAMFGTVGNQTRLDQDIAWSEGKRTHVAVNIIYNLANSGLNYIRIFVNGRINREMPWTGDDTFVQYVDGVKTSGGIVIGAPQAEIDIYGIRIYKKALSSSDVMQDYSAALPTAEEKRTFRDSNAITVNGLINYEYAKAKYNTLLWKPNASTVDGIARLATYGDGDKLKQYGDLVVSIVGDEAHSGTLSNMSTKGQGTSSMSYWKWNQRFEFTDSGFFTNLLGVRYEKMWQLVDGIPFSARNDAKINWASPMQSHKMGATALYHDCWKKIIKNNTITSTEGGQDFTGTEGGYADCRIAVRQKQFMMFVQETEDSEPVFYGLFTMGPGKGDKPTFGYDKVMFPDFTMLEGCDNDKILVMHRVPWDSYISGSVADEIWKYNGEDNWELSMGSGNLWEEFKDAFNFVYMHHTDIHPYVGTLSQLKVDTTVDQNKDYWVTVAGDGASQYDLYRYDIVDKDWVPAGMERTTLNVNAQCGNIASGVDWDATNAKFVAKRMEMFKAEVGNHYHVEDALFTMMFLRLVGATDNRGKNTYLYKVVAGDKIMFFQDDLDSIFPADNVGRKTKPYWIEEHDVNDNGQPYWNSSRNAFYNLMEQCYPDECRAMMNSILTAMAELGGGTLEGCYQKYFYDIQENIPAVAYNEVARLLYEDAAKALADGRYQTNTPPLPQCLGDQLQSEKEWNKKRAVYCSSYASYGEFASGEVSGALAFRSITTTTGASPKYSFTVVPHIWLYPANGTGDSVFPTHTRVKAGEEFTFPERTSDGNTNVRINGINYYRTIGEFGDKSVGEAFALSGERLTEFVAASDAPEFRITSMTVAARNLELLDMTGIATLQGSLDLSKMTRLKSVKLSGTSLTSLILPETDALTTLELPATLTSLRITNQPSLVSVKMDGTANLQSLYIDHGKAKNFDSKAIMASLYAEGNAPAEVTVLNAAWTAFPTKILEWMVDNVTVLTLTGTIALDESGSKMTWVVKNKVNAKFGDVDSGSGDLTLSYVQTAYDNDRASIKGYFFADNEKVYTGSQVFPFAVAPNSIYQNNQTSVKYSIECSKSGHYTMNSSTGNLTVDMTHANLDTETTAIINAVVTTADGAEHELTKEINFWKRPAKVGDVVYYDGSYADAATDNGEKTVVGICCYVAPRNEDGTINATYHNPADRMTRLCVSKGDVTAGSSSENFTSWQWGAYPVSSNADDPLWAEKYSLYSEELQEDGTIKKVNLSLDGGVTTIYDVPNLMNLDSGGLVDANGNSTSCITEDSFRDYSGDHTANDDFKPIAANYALGDGFAYNESQNYVNARTLDATLALLAGSGYAEGDVVNSGYAKTLRVIAHRDNIISHVEQTGAINGLEIPLVYPSKQGSETELDALARCMSAVRAWAKSDEGLGDAAYGNKWSQLYYPVISACYAYEPKGLKTGEVLTDKFKAHNWFLPPEGLLGRLWYYTYDYVDTNGDGTNELIDRADSPFVMAVSKGLFSKFTASYHWSVTEYSSTNSWLVRFGGGSTHNNNKYNTYVGRAVSAF